MTPHSESRDSQTPPPSEIRKPQSQPAGRPRALDDVKRREICALVAGGCGLREAARYVRCSVKTIRREADRNPAFHEQLSRSEMYAQLSPLRAMQHACSTHWRAAAWFLERAFPHRFARRDPTAFGPQQARRLLNEVLDVVGSEIANPFQHERIEKRLRATFEYSLRAACDRRRSARDLRRAIHFFEQKDRQNDPLAQFGFPTPDIDVLFNSSPKRRPPGPVPAGQNKTRPQPGDAIVPGADFAVAAREILHSIAERLASDPPPTGPQPTPVPDKTG